MSGTQTYAEMIDQPSATNAELSTALYPILIPGVNGAPATTKLATPAQVTATIETGTIVGSELTAGAVSTTIPSLPAIAPAGGSVVLQGFIIAQDQTSGDCAQWNIALTVKRVPNGLTCTTFGDTTPSLFASEGTVETLSAPTLGANSSGPVISMAGVAGLTIAWDFNLSFTESTI